MFVKVPGDEDTCASICKALPRAALAERVITFIFMKESGQHENDPIIPVSLVNQAPPVIVREAVKAASELRVYVIGFGQERSDTYKSE